MATTRVTQTELQHLMPIYRAFFEGLKACFVGRDRNIEGLMRAIIMRQHVLVFGPPGTSKTKLCDVAFSGIDGAKAFQTELTMFMTDDAIFGPYDVRKMREEGVLEHNVDGMMPQANFARLGEFLDGSQPLLRSLLRVLNEREMVRGRQILQVPLVTAFCDTNKHPQDILKTNPYLWAVLDRILFFQEVSYLEEAADVTEMIKRFQSGQVISNGHRISLDIVNRLSEPIVCPPDLIRDETIYLKLGEALVEYRRRRRSKIATEKWKVILPEISDRRLCVASSMLEANAVLESRLRCVPEDMREVRHAIGTTPEEDELWREIIEPKIQEVRDIWGQQVNVVQNSFLANLDRLMQQLESDINNSSVPATECSGTIKDLEFQLSELRPEEEPVEEGKQKATTRISELRERLTKRILQEAGLE